MTLGSAIPLVEPSVRRSSVTSSALVVGEQSHVVGDRPRNVDALPTRAAPT